MNMSHTAVFETTDAARDAIQGLRAAGVPDSAISVIGKDGTVLDNDDIPETDRVLDEEGDERLTTEGETHAMRGVLGGGALGALLGVAAVAIPGPGTIVAAGAIAAAGTGFLLGAGLGGLGELLTQHGVAPEDVAFYEERIGLGGVLVSVSNDAAASSAGVDDILASAGGRRSSTSTAATSI